jgi:S-formylglutathione hydrolase FrmB
MSNGQSHLSHGFRTFAAYGVFFLCLSASGWAQGRVDCGAMNSRILKQTVRYCALLPTEYDAQKARRYPILYFLHGLGENEQVLFQSGGWNLVEDLRQKHKVGEFLIVTPDAKETFYVNSADGKMRYSDFFLEEFMPAIESKYRVRRERAARAISGVSMGGYGAFRFAFAHPQLFSAVSAESAAFMIQTPQQMDATMQSDSQMARLMGPVFGNPIRAAQWEQNSPFVLAQKNKSAVASLAIYFNCGKDDDFGFENGALAMDRLLREENIKHEFHLYEGNHGMEYFLAHLEEVLEFHSRNFGGRGSVLNTVLPF